MLSNLVKKFKKDKSIKIKLVAIAKDEASCFADWVHHHLYFGFDAIEIYINRTTDNSAQVLDGICNAYPQVSWDKVDWIDKCPGNASKEIQFIVYNKVWYETQKQGDFTHIFFLDIDEFWIERSFDKSIQDFLSGYQSNDVISFEWLNDLGDLPKFSSLPQVVEGNVSPLVKTLYPINADVKELRHHVPLFGSLTNHILVDGAPFRARENLIQAVSPEQSSLKQSFIYHRANRSLFEYVSLLYRGRPGDDFPYKSNRYGLSGKTNDFDECKLPDGPYANYVASLEKFISQVGFNLFEAEARLFVEERYQAAINKLDESIELNYPLMMQVFHGVKLPNVLAAFKTYREKRIELEPNNVELIRDLAIQSVSQNIDEAIALMEKARELRPEGPMINQKLEEFKVIKANFNS